VSTVDPLPLPDPAGFALRGARTVLVPLGVEHEAAIVAAIDDEVLRWLPLPRPYGPADAAWFRADSERSWAEGSCATFAIMADGFAGCVDLKNRGGGSVELGFWAAASARGRGLVSDAGRAACAWAFEQFGTSLMIWRGEVGNVGSRRVAEAIGFHIAPARLRGTDPRKGLVWDWRGTLEPGQRPAPRGPVLDDEAEPTAVTSDGLHLRLRRWRAEDVDAAWELASRPEVRAVHVRPPADRAALAQRLLDGDVADRAEGTSAAFAVVDDRTGALLGDAGLRIVDAMMGVGMISYAVVPSARGRGVATASVRALATWAFDTVGLRRLEIGHDPANTASCLVASRAGFPAEGLRRGCVRYSDGRWHDDHLHARLASDGPADGVSELTGSGPISAD
jgi:RimJ/RimL family protein N-acetyltransferase